VDTEVTKTNGLFGGGLPADRFGSGGGIDLVTGNTIWGGYKVGSAFEMHRFRTTDNGATWPPEQITTGGANHGYPIGVKNGPTALRVTWLSGTFSTPTSINVGTIGGGG
jgi:hypothetical protein